MQDIEEQFFQVKYILAESVPLLLSSVTLDAVVLLKKFLNISVVAQSVLSLRRVFIST